MRQVKKSEVGYRIGIYIRVSTEEQAENPEGSIKNQEQRLRDYVKQRASEGRYGEVSEIFCDPGISAKDMNRPALQRMLSKVRSGEITLVLVTEISRLTRSTKDFALLWEFLKDQGCKFQSLRDNFDTTTPAGEMILFTLANFAQFERKQLGERIANALSARAKRGLWNGGVLPLGYQVDPEKPGHLKVVDSEAEIVRRVFETFLKEETLSQTGKKLNEEGVRLPRKPRNGGGFRHAHFTIEATYRFLTNRAYIAKRAFESGESTSEVNAVWQPIIDEVTFERVQRLLSANKSKRKPSSKERFPYLLSGLTVCKTCGDRLCGKSAHGNGGKIGYYEHAWATKTQSCLSKKVFSCSPHRVLAKKIEPVVWEDVKRLLSDPVYAEQIFEEAKAKMGRSGKVSDGERLKAKISSLTAQIEATTERVSELPKGISAQSFYDQILRLQKTKEEFERSLEAMKTQEQNRDLAISLGDFRQFTESLKRIATATTDGAAKASICRKLIEKIEVSPSGITIHYYVGESHFERDIVGGADGIEVNQSKQGNRKSSHRGSGEQSSGPFFISKPLEKYRIGREEGQTVVGSNSLTNGSQTLTSPELLQVHKKIELSGAEQTRISETFVELYRQGLSLTDIAKQTGKAKTSIRSHLLRAGIDLRSRVSVPVQTVIKEPGKRNIRPYFGFCYFQGKIVADPREYDHLLLINSLWKSGLNPNAIANRLNEKKIPARSATIWNRNSVVNILERFENGLIVSRGGQLELK